MRLHGRSVFFFARAHYDFHPGSGFFPSVAALRRSPGVVPDFLFVLRRLHSVRCLVILPFAYSFREVSTSFDCLHSRTFSATLLCTSFPLILFFLSSYTECFFLLFPYIWPLLVRSVLFVADVQTAFFSCIVCFLQRYFCQVCCLWHAWPQHFVSYALCTYFTAGFAFSFLIH